MAYELLPQSRRLNKRGSPNKSGGVEIVKQKNTDSRYKRVSK